MADEHSSYLYKIAIGVVASLLSGLITAGAAVLRSHDNQLAVIGERFATFASVGPRFTAADGAALERRIAGLETGAGNSREQCARMQQRVEYVEGAIRELQRRQFPMAGGGGS